MVGMVKFNIERCDGARVEGGGGVGVDPVSLSQPNPNPMRDGKPQALWWCCKLYLVRLSVVHFISKCFVFQQHVCGQLRPWYSMFCSFFFCFNPVSSVLLHSVKQM